MNVFSDLVHRLRQNYHCSCQPIPHHVFCILVPLFIASFALSIFIFVAVHNPVLFIFIFLLSSIVFVFLFWNIWNFRRNRVFLLFVSVFPHADLRTAKDGQLVKITGFASCESISLESSYEKVPGCVYTSAVVYEGRRLGSILASASPGCCGWNLVYSERLATDFFLTDTKTGLRALIKAGHDSRVIPLISENTLVRTTNSNAVFSCYLKKWLGERNLSTESRLIRLEEGYVKEGNSLTVIGLLHRNNDVAVIVQPPQAFSTGCLWLKFLLPVIVDGLILKLPDGIISQTVTQAS